MHINDAKSYSKKQPKRSILLYNSFSHKLGLLFLYFFYSLIFFGAYKTVC